MSIRAIVCALSAVALILLAGAPVSAQTKTPPVTYAPDGKPCPRDLPALGGAGRDIFLGAANSGAISAVTLMISNQPNPISTVAFSPDGSQIVTGDGQTASLWEARTGKLTERFGRAKSWLTSPKLSSDGRMMVIFDGQFLQAFDLPSARLRFSAKLPDPNIASPQPEVAISPDGSVIAASSGRDIFLFDAVNGKQLRRLTGTIRDERWQVEYGHAQGISGLAFAPNGRFLLSSSYDETLRLWDTTNGKHLRCFEVSSAGAERLFAPFESADFSPDGRAVTGASSAGVYLWEATTGKLLRAIRPQSDLGYHTAVFSPDGRMIATGGYDMATRLWKVSTGELIGLMRHPGEVFAVAFGPAGDRIVSGFGLWESPSRPAANGAWVWLPDHPAIVQAVQAEKSVAAGIVLASRGDVVGARNQYTQAEKINPFRDYPVVHARAWSLLCWYGSLYGQVRQVLDACERGVRLNPNDGSVRDSRGLARALTGNVRGAVDDFQAYVNWSYERPSNRELYEKLRNKRLAWIEALNNGRNPFDATTLEALKSE